MNLLRREYMVKYWHPMTMITRTHPDHDMYSIVAAEGVRDTYQRRGYVARVFQRDVYGTEWTPADD